MLWFLPLKQEKLFLQPNAQREISSATSRRRASSVRLERSKRWRASLSAQTARWAPRPRPLGPPQESATYVSGVPSRAHTPLKLTAHTHTHTTHFSHVSVHSMILSGLRTRKRFFPGCSVCCFQEATGDSVSWSCSHFVSQRTARWGSGWTRRPTRTCAWTAPSVPTSRSTGA